jgi:sugar/nucleoside kinase (ribokinase family)
VVGNPGLDSLLLLGDDDPDLRADGHFVSIVDTVGHAAAFSARGLARLGHEVRILGAVGEDAIGRMVTSVLHEDGIDTGALFVDPAGTPRSVNFVFPDGRRTFFFDGGSHMTLRPPLPAVEAALLGADLVVCALANWGRHVARRARGMGIPVAVDLQDVRDPADPYRADFVAAADYLFASAAHVDDPVRAARGWFAQGPARMVVFGLGPRGAMLVPRDPVAPVLMQPPPPSDLPVVDTTGCGDSLACGFLDGLVLSGLPAAQALHRGQVLARIVASQTGGSAPFDRPALEWACDASGPLRLL